MKLSKPCGALCLAVSLTAILYSPPAPGLTTDASAANADTAQDTQVAPTPAPEHLSAPRFSQGVQEVLKMMQAKVDSDVIKAYVKNSTLPYNLTAAEIIELKKHGVSDDILSALLQRDGEIRAQAAAGPVMPGSSPPPPYQTNPYQSAYPYDYSAAPYYTDYPYYSYPYYSYPYNYWWYNNWYPWGGYFSYYPFFYSSFCHFDGHGFCQFHHSFHSSHFGNSNGHWGNHGGWNHTSQGPNHASTSPFAPFNGRSTGFSGTRAMSPFGTFNPHGAGFARAPGGLRPSTGFSAPRAASFGAARPASFASHVGGFRSGGGGSGGRVGGGGHR